MSEGHVLAQRDWMLYESRCGHRWVAPVEGYFGCPDCGLYDGDHHLTAMEPIRVSDGQWPEVDRR